MRMLIVALILASTLLAQRRGGAGGFRGYGGHGFGRPGGYYGGFAGRYHRGFPGGGLRFGGSVFHGRHRGGWYPFSQVGAWYGGGYYGSPFWSGPAVYSPPYYSYPYSTAPAVVTIVTAPSAVETSRPSIIINSEVGRLRSRSEPEQQADSRRPEADTRDEPRPPEVRATRSPVYLIATHDGLVWAALGYWVEDRTLHFVTSKSERKQIPLAQLDRDLSEQLNRERSVAFRLP